MQLRKLGNTDLQVSAVGLGSDQALRKTLELVAETGLAPDDFDPLFAPLEADLGGALDGVRDMENMPMHSDPQRVRDDLDAVLARRFVPGDPRGTAQESANTSTRDKRVTTQLAREKNSHE